MKKTSLVLSLALAIVACQQEELVQPEVASSADDFVASVEDYSSATKTTLNEHKSVIWSANDQISIFNGNTAARIAQATSFACKRLWKSFCPEAPERHPRHYTRNHQDKNNV